MSGPDGAEGDVELVNLTPHPVRVISADGSALELPVAGPPARVRLEVVDRGAVTADGVAVRLTVTPRGGEVSDLPDPVPGRLLVVSRVVADACRDRRDLVFPDELVRDDAGNVVACAALSRFEADV